ncbi:MAG: hypothetical protein J6P20_03865, partial [Oscillospiraceae bacterium]|nr:hypothetical protein [Oscillospiraceae bacterium]
REAVSGEITKKAAEILEYVQKQMMRRVSEGSGNLTELTERIQIRVSALRGAEYEIPDTAEGFERAFRFFGDALVEDLFGTVKAAGKYGEGVFEVRSNAELTALTEAVTQAAREAGIGQISVRTNPNGKSTVMTFTVTLNGGNA